MESRILNVGIIGLGEVAQVIHLPVLESLPELYKIAAVCDLSAKLVEHMGARYGVPGRYTDAMELVKQQDLDVVFVINSDEYHAHCAIAAANHGKHVLIEKPMCLTMAEADAIIEARDKNNVKVMVGYMRRYAAAFEEAVKEIGGLDQIAYARVRDIIGPNRTFIQPTSRVVRYQDFPDGALEERRNRSARLIKEATGLDESSPFFNFYGLLGGLSSHDLSVMREALGMPRGVVGARLTDIEGLWFFTAIFDYGKFSLTFETGLDLQGKFDAHIEVYSARKSVKVQYNTPYIRHLPTELHVNETVGEKFTQSIIRPTLTDPYTLEHKYLYDVITKDLTPKTTPEDYKNDLVIFKMLMEALKK